MTWTSILWLRYPNYLAEPLNGYAGYKCVVHVIKSDVSLRHFYDLKDSINRIVRNVFLREIVN